METLRLELIETQKVRSDFLKWKLLIVAAVGGAALGFSGTSSGQAHLALAVIPLACAYVDLICRHLSLRNKAIGAFIAEAPDVSPVLREYEQYYAEVSEKAWGNRSHESAALLGSTLFVSIAVTPVGILASAPARSVGEELWDPLTWPAALFYASSLSWIMLTGWIQCRYRRDKKAVEILSDARTKSSFGGHLESRSGAVQQGSAPGADSPRG